MIDNMTELQIAEIKRKTEQYRRSTMTVEELCQKFSEIVKNGDGDAMIEIEGDDGTTFRLSKNARIYVSRNHEDVLGKWCEFEN